MVRCLVALSVIQLRCRSGQFDIAIFAERADRVLNVVGVNLAVDEFRVLGVARERAVGGLAGTGGRAAAAAARVGPLPRFVARLIFRVFGHSERAIGAHCDDD